MIMDYPEYERSQELAHAGDHVPEYMQAIFDDAGSGHTLSDLQRRIYKDTDAGISVGFQLDDGSYVWNGDSQARDASLVRRVHRIGFGSIVEGSEAEVPSQWLDLLGEQFDTADKAVAEFNRLVEDTNDQACVLWHEEHDQEETDPS
jgi:hypothetical protein